MGLKKVALDAGPMDVGSLENVKGRASGVTLDSADVVQKLNKQCPGIHADWGARHNLWHPRIESRQGLFYFHKHLCGMDRGVMRQWPEWSAEEELVEVPVEYALLHDDYPVCMGHVDEDSPLPDTALVFRSKPHRVQHLGWAEVFYRVLNAKLPNISRPWIEQTFKVSLAFLDQMKDAPITASYKALDQRMIGERPVNLNAQLPDPARQDLR